MSATETPFGKIPLFLLKKLGQGSASAVLVYMALAIHRNKQGLAWPSVRTLSGHVGRDRSTVFEAIRWLKQERLLVKRGYGPNRTARYYLPQLAQELPLVAAEFGIEVEVGDLGPRSAQESGKESGSQDREGPTAETQTDQLTEEHEPHMGRFAKQILEEPAFFPESSRHRREQKAIEAESRALVAGIPAGEVSDLVTEAWSIDPDRIGEILMELLSSQTHPNSP